MRRREFIKTFSMMSAVALLSTGPLGQTVSYAADEARTPAVDFSASTVSELARKLAAEKFVRPKIDLPKAVREWTYDQYRDVRYKPEQAVWSSDGLPFQVEFFHRGFIFKEPVEVHLVTEGKARRALYSPDLFNFGPNVAPPASDAVTDFSGFRLRAPIHRPDGFDEFAVFQGASYFRALAKHQGYGLSARGLALKTGAIDGEEFPFFRTFWIERPRPQTNAIVIHALLDSESTTGAYRFTIRAGDPTVMDIEMTLYPRVDLTQVGLAPLTSMFFFGPPDRVGVDDFRSAVHDSEGLAIWNGRGEWLWRPLMNPKTLQVSAFVDDSPRGFGLLQRRRDFAYYEDLESRYERRPSLWVETIGDWGSGAVQLVEIPTKFEFHDNIVVFWRPSKPLPAQAEYRFTYRLHWCWTPPSVPSVATVVATRVGAGRDTGSRLFVIDFAGGRLADLKPEAEVEPVVDVSAGTVKTAVVHFNPKIKGWRVNIVLAPNDAKLCDVRCILKLGAEFLSEVWSYRWIV